MREAEIPPRPRRRLRWRRALGWALFGGAAGYALAWFVVSAVVLGMSSSARADDDIRHRTTGLPGVHNLTRVDDKVWRGGAPTAEGYRRLAGLGIHTVVDLRAEELSPARLGMPAKAGLKAIRLPIRDGQPPSAEQVERFLAVVETAPGPVFVHCGAGVGRTGSMSAAYLVRSGQADAGTATLRSLAVGPPTLEQIAFMRALRKDGVSRPPGALVAFSRLADSPRRAWSRLTH